MDMAEYMKGKASTICSTHCMEVRRKMVMTCWFCPVILGHAKTAKAGKLHVRVFELFQIWSYAHTGKPCAQLKRESAYSILNYSIWWNCRIQ